MRTARQWTGFWRTRGAPALALLLLLASLGSRARAESLDEGQFISINSPLTSEEVNAVKKFADWALGSAQNRARFKLILDFNPGNAPASTADFGPCYSLQKYLLGLQDVTTVAFVHGEVSRHTVLPVLACRELVMSSQARLGPVLQENDPELTPTELQAYRDVIARRNRCPAVVLKLIDRDMEVLEGTRQGALWFIDARQEKEARERDGVVVVKHEPVIGKGVVAYSATQAQTLGLCRLTCETREQVKDAYNLGPSSLREDGLVDGNPTVWRFVITGQVNDAQVESLKRRLKRALNPDRHANLIVLQLECGGGDLASALALAEFLRTLRDGQHDRPIKTVAYVPENAPDTATVVALGCSEIVLRKGAKFGDFSLFAGREEEQGGAEAVNDPDRDSLQLRSIRTLAQERGYNPLLIRGFFYRRLEIDEVFNQTEGRWQLVDGEQLSADGQKAKPVYDHQRVRQVKAGGPDGKLLVLDAEQAKEVHLAGGVVDDLPGLYAEMGVKPDRVHTAGSDWLDDLAYLLRLPGMTIFLFVLGITCLFLELKLTGVGLPGVVAALCFVLLFWAHAHDWGITMLAVLLFVLGLILIGVEIFVMPGVAVLGLSGAILMVVSVTLVTVDRWPQTQQDWLGLGGQLVTFGLCLVGSVFGALLLAWYLPHIPYVNRLILKPPGEAGEEGIEEVSGPILPDMSWLLGAIGVAETPLRPAGKVKFGDEFVDVVAEGSYVPPGSRVQVIEIEGYRVVVKEV